MHGPVADGQRLLLTGFTVLAVTLGGVGFGAGAESGQAGILGAEPPLPA